MKQVIYLSQDSTYTVAIGLAFLRWQIAQGDPVPGLLMAATVFTSLPMIVIFFIGQKYGARHRAHRTHRHMINNRYLLWIPRSGRKPISSP